ncbi:MULTISPECIES: anthranilate phosphoribosyltransferase [unclassified Nostoc]|uniref:anthranilate phosphoribosyltransferase n=1 Tax=unclassified Nostoc TaxID=2593658 RepID=UPI002AD59ADA|nr:anthranilate phosphoribosyltransferase [Nostoc sp. DedQUE03]MDZ7975965.1 anthranilate phosphoribosyltransferase [Nostoc sp. DedQUE03]MDZ8044800.1 anthranilate phosphoribosyltransferase [Nostoc sp. DedQUE02]
MIAAIPTLNADNALTSDSQDWSTLLQQLLDRQSLSVFQAKNLMQGWLTEAIPIAQSGAILAAIQAKGVAPEELVGLSQVLRQQSLQLGTSSSPRELGGVKDKREGGKVLNPLPFPLSPFPNPHQSLLGCQTTSDAINSYPLIDTCGTGGDGASTFNISTAVAFVVAAAGIKVAKHGNRSASSQAGSADVLETLGLNLYTGSDRVIAALDEVGITFLFAPTWHPAFKVVSPLRKTLKIRTVFNLLGPLLNPLPLTGQVIGVYNPNLMNTIAQALNQLGTRRAIVLHGREKLDEAGLADLTDMVVLADKQLHQITLNPQDLGLKPAATTQLAGGNANENAEILKAVLQGKGTQAQQDVVALNAALALQVGEAIASTDEINFYAKGVTLAKDILQSGEAWMKLEQLIRILH